MSVQAMTWAWAVECPNGTAKLVLLCLANYADEHGSCFPGQKKIAEQCGVCLRTVKDALARLEQAGLLSREHRQRADGTRTSDRYYLELSKVQDLHKGAEAKVQDLSNQGAESAPQYKPNGLSEPVREPSETRARGIRTTAFDEWWISYPHKVGKAAAKKAFRQAVALASIDELRIGVQRYIDTKPPDRPWCNPATWLNQERWKDEPAEVQNGQDDWKAERDAARQRLRESQQRHREELQANGAGLHESQADAQRRDWCFD